MTKILAISMAALTALAINQSAQARDRDDQISGQTRGPSVSVPRTQMRATMPANTRLHSSNMAADTRVGSRSMAVNPGFRSSTVTTNPQLRARTGTTTTTSPSVAFGGSDRRFRSGDTREFRSGGMSVRPSLDIYRNWDRGRIHTWNNHRYHWSGGDWVLLDNDLDYGPTVSTYSTDVIDSDSLAADVQSRLLDRGYNPGPVDGVIGSQTRDAIADFQADHGLPVTGHINNSLLRSLGL